ncbi:MAG: 4Fe-4S dicluster domain-containing protein [Prevotellaceae bacterium]|jgi:polyferredoxin|nr:4Fe-4S dicluster domain-containing protein [Prevotellaceae bacterium]
MLRITRITLSIVFFTLITFFFIDFAGLLPNGFHALAHLQFVPAWCTHSVGIVLFIIVLTLVFGRIYCSSICPMGVFQDIVAWISKRTARKKKRYSFSKAKTVLRWSVLVAVWLAFWAGFPLLLGLLDPYSAFGRMATHLLRPVYLFGNNLLADVFSHFDNYTFYEVQIGILSVSSLIVAIVTFLAVAHFAWRHGRTFCNTLCPVGTVLGLVSRISLFKVRINTEKCNHCGLCATKCKAACIDSKNQAIDYSRCVDCFDCLGSCKQKALAFTFNPSFLRRQESPAKKGIAGQARNDVDMNRRKFFAAGLATAVATPAALAVGAKNFSPLSGGKGVTRQIPIAPPGAISHENLQTHCTSCHLCVSKCPSHVLKPSFLEYGLGGMMQPLMSFEDGFCNYNCTKCSNICPNGALQALTTDGKHRTQMGHAVFNKDVCVVYVKGNNCGACAEHCPTQAVSMQPIEGKPGLTAPVVDTNICIGCGGCEFICPVRPHRAIFVEGNEVQGEAVVAQAEKTEEVELDGFGF